MYLGVVVVMVRRQLRQVTTFEEEEDRVVMTDQKGNTDIHKVDTVLSNSKEVLM